MSSWIKAAVVLSEYFWAEKLARIWRLPQVWIQTHETFTLRSINMSLILRVVGLSNELFALSLHMLFPLSHPQAMVCASPKGSLPQTAQISSIGRSFIFTQFTGKSKLVDFSLKVRDLRLNRLQKFRFWIRDFKRKITCGFWFLIFELFYLHPTIIPIYPMTDSSQLRVKIEHLG